MGSKLKLCAMFFFAILLPTLAFAQALPPVVLDPSLDPNVAYIKLIIDSIGGMKGLGAWGISAVIIQLIIVGLNLPIVGGLFGSAYGWVKLLIVSGLSMVVTPIALMATTPAMDFGAALLHSATLAAVMVFINQIIQHFLPKPQGK